MKAPFFSVLSLLIPAVAAVAGYILARNAKGATNMGEALGPFFAAAFAIMISGAFGEASAVIALVRGERLQWIAWLGTILNAGLVLPLLYLLVISDWK